MRILVCYGTTEGQTRKVAEYVAEIVEQHGHEPALFEASQVSEWEPSHCQAAILAGSVHMGRYQTSLVHHLKRWHSELNAMPSVFISVSLSAASNDPHEQAEVDELAQNMLHQTGWTPLKVHHAAGALLFSQYDFFKRWAMRLIALQRQQKVDPTVDTEYTDWDELTRFTEDFIVGLPPKLEK